MAYLIPKTWGGFRTVYSINTYNYSIGDGNLIFNTGAGGIYPSPPCSVLFRTTLFARLIFQVQPWFELDDQGNFYLYGSIIYGGLIPDKEWSYFRGKTVTAVDASFAITDDAQQNYTVQAAGGFPPIASIEGFTAF